ncbi:DMT family transporter [Algirhabdus cladophorae]|uniref:DMT family transporter n=1 Tax=Algirhabdus cladophorae TaxID=3377108 RepID=UPI003B847FB2
MDLRALIYGLLFALMWSSAFTSARIIVQDAPPLMSLTARFFVSGALGLILAYILGQSFRLSRSQWFATILFGLCQNALYLGLNFVAMQTIEASLASIIASTLPLVVAVAGLLFLGETTSARGIWGIVTGIAGVCLIMGLRLSGGVDMLAVGLCCIAVVSLAVATLLARGAASGGNIMTIVGLQMIVGGAILAVPAMLFETPAVNLTPSLVLAFIYTTLVPGLAATWIWFKLIERIGAVRAATFHFLNPVFGVAIAAVLLSEPLGPWDVIGVFIVAVSIYVVQTARQIKTS